MKRFWMSWWTAGNNIDDIPFKFWWTGERFDTDCCFSNRRMK